MIINKIACQRIKENARINHTAEQFGSNFPMALEPAIYTFADRLSPDYSGGYWHFYQLSNGGFYMAPDDDEPYLVISDNGFEGMMSADALGITACLYTYSHLSFNPDLDEICTEHYHLLREFMLDHAEVRTILSAID